VFRFKKTPKASKDPKNPESKKSFKNVCVVVVGLQETMEDIVIGRDSNDENQYHSATERPNALAQLNKNVEGRLPDSTWNEWLWGTDALRECSISVMMNRMHLVGLAIARS
jgi:hypothetical protein